MGKVSIGLRGWRFDEDEVFTEDGEFRPMDEIPKGPRKRLIRLQALVNAPCDACWLIHGDENVHECNVAEVVYGEALGEVVLCADHEPDFLYWFSEAGGSQFKGEQELQDEFHEWFLDGGRAPDGYGGVEHVETDPEDVPEPPEPDQEELNVDVPEDEQKRIDLRNMDEGESGDGSETADESAEGGDEDLDDLDLGRDYPS
ncbi:hypothetical protein [Halorussus sp. MSC15.2]|uniref:hypothetical protein n=1 Tax=Halorussus sp. MSC15.2 TaxID=2283638 RepID=UPI0013D0526C|nr:hypothetical protein [Halorussus sp. MSC15.2]NEU56857.1 hypothetical protein [Halorussus sp. MSC15.2]